jgi:hypothetical protein
MKHSTVVCLLILLIASVAFADKPPLVLPNFVTTILKANPDVSLFYLDEHAARMDPATFKRNLPQIQKKGVIPINEESKNRLIGMLLDPRNYPDFINLDMIIMWRLGIVFRTPSASVTLIYGSGVIDCYGKGILRMDVFNQKGKHAFEAWLAQYGKQSQ